MGTFALVFAGCGVIMIHELYPETVPTSAIPVVFGLVITIMIYALGHISGAHFNPSVTFAFALVKRFKYKEIIPYWIGQFTGALSAIALLIIILPETQTIGATIPDIHLWQAWIWEFILTFFLMFVIIAVATDSRAISTMSGAAIGAAVMLDAMIGGPVTGASMNPARSFAPALFSAQLEYIWLYITAPTLGAISAAFLYEYIRCDEQQYIDKQNAEGCC